ncbi:MAG: 30S ribosomal protein S20 [Bdellovibrionales bacterium]|nr:30S ribosomal protein S20 [Bdellovibrionales bacterium]
MANIKSAEKQARQAIVRRDRNQQTKKAVRTSERKLREAMSSGAADKIEELYRDFSSKIAKAAQKGIIHASTASRKVGRIATAISSAAAKK